MKRWEGEERKKKNTLEWKYMPNYCSGTKPCRGPRKMLPSRKQQTPFLEDMSLGDTWGIQGGSDVRRCCSARDAAPQICFCSQLTLAERRPLKRMGQICEDPLGLRKKTHGTPAVK